MSPLIIAKGTTLATSASVIREDMADGDDTGIANAANPVIEVAAGALPRGAEVTLRVGGYTVEISLSGADRLSLVELLLGRRVTETEEQE